MTALLIAHRGLSADYPENTRLAFNKAWQCGCDGIELDIQITKDQQVVVHHDASTLRTTQQSYLISAANWTDIAELNAGQNQRIPLLVAVIAEVPKGKLVQIEVKEDIEQLAPVIDLLMRLRSDIKLQIISFDCDKLIDIQAQIRGLAHMACLLVYNVEKPAIPDPIAFAKKYGLAGLDVDYRLATDELINDMKKQQLKIGTWTVNDTNTAKVLISRGVDMIASDIADKIMRPLRRS